MLPLSPSRARQGGPLPSLDDLMASEFLDTPRGAAWALPAAAHPSWSLPASWLPPGGLSGARTVGVADAVLGIASAPHAVQAIHVSNPVTVPE